MLEVYRKELKYLVNQEEMMRLQVRLGAVMKKDSHTDRDGYLVRSLYFDSLFDMDFEEKLQGLDDRQKVRLRVYDPSGQSAKLELKEKSGSLQRKRSLVLTRDEAQQMVQGDYGFLLERKEPLAPWLYTFLMEHCYRPKCIVEYDRVAYMLDENNTRVTFDCRLRATEASVDLFDETMMLYPVADPAQITMEVKYDGFLFSYVKEELSLADKIQVSNSKYCRARMITKHGLG